MTTYLSLLVLDARRREVRRDLADCNVLHRTVLSAFPGVHSPGGVRAHFGVLYRLEPEGRATAERRLLVQSSAVPDWGHLPAGYAFSEPECKRVDGYYDRLENGDVLRFRLRANPTKRVSAHDGSDGQERWVGKRVEIRGEEAQLGWLCRKGEQGGFALLDVRVAPGVVDVLSVPEVQSTGRRVVAPGKTARLTFGSALIEGRLRVTDTGLFRDALRQGIGSGKAYGFGLLSVAATRE